MESKFLLSLILLSSWVLLGFSGRLINGEGLSFACMIKFSPCGDNTKNPSSPLKECCEQLEGMVTNDTKCLCDIFNDPRVLKSYNVTQEDALKLPTKGCGINVNITVCNEVAMDEDLTSDDQPGSDNQVFTYFAIADKGDLMSPTHRKPALRSLLISATVGDALLALKRSEESYLSIWICDHSSEEKPDFVPLFVIVWLTVMVPSPATSIADSSARISTL
ncbi:hypothetical protein NE237_007856 [Protea cynaroides]|uniref:Bifunctional inhibitor/plant lipid transfer protein/seed storage helical domain-containing protein n=1 Tax=Protea cynaroides TaxID=273540 RepID=A0A9Q0QWS9_9MAGN|nr:hypothetical protein NE237_007856 [Protea cynaroides]